MTDVNQGLVEATDYYPYGSQRTMKTYKTHVDVWYYLITAAGTVGLIIIGLTKGTAAGILLLAGFLLFGWMIAITVPSRFTRLIIQEKPGTLIYKRLWGTKTIPIDSIFEISDRPEYVIAHDTFRRLVIFYKDEAGHDRYIKINPVQFKQSDLSDFLKVLRQMNSDMKIDAAAA